jgi:hypothetical protein
MKMLHQMQLVITLLWVVFFLSVESFLCTGSFYLRSVNLIHLKQLKPYVPRPSYAVFAMRKRSSSPASEEEKPGSKRPIRDDVIQLVGRITESLPNALFRVELEPSKQMILATISGRPKLDLPTSS